MYNIQQLVQKVLNEAFVLNLGTADEQGPWVASLVYVADEQNNLYWVSSENSRHSLALAKNPKAACSILADFSPQKERALQIAGTVQMLPEVPNQIKQLLEKKSNIPMEKLGTDYRWYKLTPSTIELIHNELFGYARQRLL